MATCLVLEVFRMESIEKVSAIESGYKNLLLKVAILSTFALIGIVTVAPTYAAAEAGSVGESGNITIEPVDNIAQSEVDYKNITANTKARYAFSAPEHGIYQIVITGNETERDVAIRVEALNGISKLVTAPPPGVVYKNVNIWAGTTKTKEVVIRFKVEYSWILSNGLRDDEIKMLKWDGGKWITLETIDKSRDRIYKYYEAKTDAFSIFAISGVRRVKGIATPIATPITTPEVAVTPEFTPAPEVSIPTIPPSLISALMYISIGLIFVLISYSLIYGRRVETGVEEREEYDELVEELEKNRAYIERHKESIKKLKEEHAGKNRF